MDIHGYSVAEFRRARKYRRISVVLRIIHEYNYSEQLRILIIMCLLAVRNVTGNRIAENPIFYQTSSFARRF